jgi:hypothetical protein
MAMKATEPTVGVPDEARSVMAACLNPLHAGARARDAGAFRRTEVCDDGRLRTLDVTVAIRPESVSEIREMTKMALPHGQLWPDDGRGHQEAQPGLRSHGRRVGSSTALDPPTVAWAGLTNVPCFQDGCQ